MCRVVKTDPDYCRPCCHDHPYRGNFPAPRRLFHAENVPARRLSASSTWRAVLVAETRGEARDEARGEARGESGGEARGEARDESRGESRGEARCEARGEARGEARDEGEGEALPKGTAIALPKSRSDADNGSVHVGQKLRTAGSKSTPEFVYTLQCSSSPQVLQQRGL